MFPWLPQDGSAPSEIPEVEVPPADFTTIGEGIGKGLKAAKVLEPVGDFLVGGLKKVLIWLIQLLTGAAAWIATAVLHTLTEADEKTDSAYAQLTAATLEHIFGANFDAGALAGRGQYEQRRAIATQIGQQVLGAMFPTMAAAGSGGVEPSSKAAEDYLQTVVHLGLEGWFESWIVDALSLHEFERFGDLKDVMAEMLGLGRLTRRVLAPPLKIMVEDPFTWKLNKIYRPKLLSDYQCVKQFLRGRWNKERLTEELARQGYSDEGIEAVINDYARFLAVADLDYLISRGVWTDDEAKQHLVDQGYSEDMATTHLALAKARRLEPYYREMASTVLARVSDKTMTTDDARPALDVLPLPDEEKHLMLAVAGLKAEYKHTDLSISDIDTAIKRGLLTVNDLRARLLKAGYSLDDAQTLELMLLTDIKTATDAAAAKKAAADARAKTAADKAAAAQAKQQAAAQKLAAKNVSLATEETLVKKGIRSMDDYRAFLVEQKFSQPDIQDLVALLSQEIDQAVAKQQAKAGVEAAAADKHIPLSSVESAVKRGILTMQDYVSFLHTNHFAPADIDLMTAIMQADLAAAQQAAAVKTAATATLAKKGLSLSDYERGVRLGLKTLDDYDAWLVGQGFSQSDADLLTGELADQVNADQAAAGTKATVSTQLAAKGLSLTQLEAGVRAGLKTMADYRAALAAAGYGADDVDTLAGLLQLHLDQDKATADKQAAAAAKLAAKQLSLAEVERAVKLGVLTLDQYRAFLAREGFSADDVQILALSVAAELAQTKQAQQTDAKVGAQLKAKGLSLAQMELAVRQGVRTIYEYQAFLAGQGYSLADQQTLVALLQLRMEQDQAGAAKRAAAGAASPEREAGLAKFEQAVLDGLRSMADYQAFLVQLGYGDDDIAVLVDVLQFKLDAKAAKEAGQAGG